VSLTARLAALLVILLALSGAAWKLHHAGYTSAKAEMAAEAQIQKDRNLELQRASEKRYTVNAEVRDRFIIETITEVRHETDNLRACVLTPAARGLLNAAAACADSPASCSSGEPVRPASSVSRIGDGAGLGRVDYRLGGNGRL